MNNKDLISRGALLEVLKEYGKQPIPDMRTQRDYEHALTNMFACFKNEVINAVAARDYEVTSLETGKVLTDEEILLAVNTRLVNHSGSEPYSMADFQDMNRRQRVFMFDWLPRSLYVVDNNTL
jgi:hypothetical protein